MGFILIITTWLLAANFHKVTELRINELVKNELDSVVQNHSDS